MSLRKRIGIIDHIDLLDLVDLRAFIVRIDLTDLRKQLQKELTKDQKDSDWG